uniref:Uncharacterized protein n=1 Tax=Mimivirus LCMiAC01 TaxID=2506608 RepID=A0A481YZM2_9VIRU|nr:MAG: hypothetical protein LCMiAC01_03360 [Mimivirus LCMiAC01]
MQLPDLEQVVSQVLDFGQVVGQVVGQLSDLGQVPHSAQIPLFGQIAGHSFSHF